MIARDSWTGSMQAMLMPLAAAFLLAVPAGCASRAPESAATTPVPGKAKALPEPSTGERYLAAARQAMAASDWTAASERLEFILALDRATPQRAEALYLTALLEARPGNGERDTARAMELLEEAVDLGPAGSRGTEAVLVLQLLRAEREQERIISQLNAWLDGMESEHMELRAALEQREEELRKIKEILLGKTAEP